MNVVVLGATSVLGAQIAISFADGNHLFIVGRRPGRLDTIAAACRAAGARHVAAIVDDLRLGLPATKNALADQRVDLVINAASATSRLRDDHIPATAFSEYAQADVLTPIEFIQGIAARDTSSPLTIIFLSTFLTAVRSPNRLVYSSFKLIQEEYLRRLAADYPNVSVLRVRISKLISPHKHSPDSLRLANAILDAYRKKKAAMTFGSSGVLLSTLFCIQPMAFHALMLLQRTIRRATDARQLKCPT